MIYLQQLHSLLTSVLSYMYMAHKMSSDERILLKQNCRLLVQKLLIGLLLIHKHYVGNPFSSLYYPFPMSLYRTVTSQKSVIVISGFHHDWMSLLSQIEKDSQTCHKVETAKNTYSNHLNVLVTLVTRIYVLSKPHTYGRELLNFFISKTLGNFHLIPCISCL